MLKEKKQTFHDRSKKYYKNKSANFELSLEAKLMLPFKKKLLSLIFVPTNGKVLDVGCGSGSFLNMISKQFDFEGYGVDISENILKTAQISNPTMHFETAISESIPFNNESFDVMTTNLSYHHFENVGAFAQEAFRLLKPKGLIYINEMYSPEFLRGFLNVFVPLIPAGCIKIFSPDEIINNFETNGFKKYSFDKSGHIQIIAFQKLEI